MKRMPKLLFVLFPVLTSTACFEPKYVRPKAPEPASYKERDAHWQPARPSDSIARGSWWELFGDERLNKLEGQVMAGNQSLQAAEAQFRESRAAVSAAISGFFPVVSAQASVDTQKSYAGGARSTTLYSLPLSASWEPDFWGKVRLTADMAKGAAQASAANLENARLSLQAQLAVAYFGIESLDMQEVILSSTVAGYEAALQLTVDRFNSGVASQADVVQARAQLEATRAQATDLKLSRAQLEHAIAVLTGIPPSDFTLDTGSISGPPPELPTGLPSQLLERRPDIAAAERQVYSANAGVGLARAAYFPVVSLTGAAGFQSSSAAQWFSWPSRFFSLGASAAETLVDFGKRKAGRKQAWAAYDASVADYRTSVLTAFQQVEDDLAALRLLAVEAGQQDSAMRAAQESLNLTFEQYRHGLVSYLSVIQVQNTALAAENAAVQILGRRMTSAVNLLRDLGGGWDASQLPSGSGLRATFPSGSQVRPPAR